MPEEISSRLRNIKRLAYMSFLLAVSATVVSTVTIYPRYYEHASALTLRSRGFRVFFDEKVDWLSQNVTTYLWHVTVIRRTEKSPDERLFDDARRVSAP